MIGILLPWSFVLYCCHLSFFEKKIVNFYKEVGIVFLQLLPLWIGAFLGLYWWNYFGVFLFLVLVRELEINEVMLVLILFWAFWGFFC
jgi:hypothetical protein